MHHRRRYDHIRYPISSSRRVLRPLIAAAAYISGRVFLFPEDAADISRRRTFDGTFDGTFDVTSGNQKPRQGSVALDVGTRIILRRLPQMPNVLGRFGDLYFPVVRRIFSSSCLSFIPHSPCFARRYFSRCGYVLRNRFRVFSGDLEISVFLSSSPCHEISRSYHCHPTVLIITYLCPVVSLCSSCLANSVSSNRRNVYIEVVFHSLVDSFFPFLRIFI